MTKIKDNYKLFKNKYHFQTIKTKSYKLWNYTNLNIIKLIVLKNNKTNFKILKKCSYELIIFIKLKD